jgi:Cu/Ag efflux protein CusF
METKMRKSLVIAASLGSMLISAAAFAAPLTAAGAIKSIDAKGNFITLADGKVYSLPKGFDLKTLKTGEKVSITYDLKDKLMVATAVKAG